MINIDDRIFKDGLVAKIGTNAFTLLVALELFRNENDESCPSTPTMQKLTGMGRDAVLKSYKVLVQNGLIERGQTKGRIGQFNQAVNNHKCLYISNKNL